MSIYSSTPPSRKPQNKQTHKHKLKIKPKPKPTNFAQQKNIRKMRSTTTTTTTKVPDGGASSSSSAAKQTTTANSHGPKRTRLMRIIGRSLLGLMVLVGLAIVICWLLVFPKTPIFTVESGQVTPHSLTDRKLNATVAFTVKSFNPNKRASIHVDHLVMTMDEMGQKFRTSVPTFSQTPGNQTVFNLTALLQFSYPFGGLDERVKLDGISPELRFFAEVSYILERWTSKRRTVEIYCNHLRLKINGTTPLDNTKCKVDL